MNIGIYNPYFDTLSGGERYCLMLASHWSKKHKVSIFWRDASLLDKAQQRLEIDLSRVRTVPNFFEDGGIAEKIWLSSRYDLILFLSDGSMPLSFARRNILHFQMPFPRVALPIWKYQRYQKVVCNSHFTLDHMNDTVLPKATVIYPPVSQIGLSGKKTDTIFTVGRFHPVKKQDILISAFKKLLEQKAFATWKLVLAGGLLDQDKKYFASLEKMVVGYPITIIPNAAHGQLSEYYRNSSLYWHAAGFEETNPQLMEHFGISTVEAMSAGCVPLVYDGGGLGEIVDDYVNGFLWKTQDQLIKKTIGILENPKNYSKVSKSAAQKSKLFSEEKFFDSFDDVLRQIVL
jgi:glycosyltransferase involved in cell wall biosynthesis